MKRLPMLAVLSFVAAFSAAAEPGSFDVSVEGSGRPMILIPGLASPGTVWDGTITRYSGRFETHTLTLAGFAGVAPIEGELLPRVRQELVEYIKEKELDRPVIVGHSLGGFLAFWIASTEPELVGPIVAVDGLPALGALMNADVTAAQLATQGEAMYALLSAQSAEQFAAQTRSSLSGMITSRDDVDRVAAEAVKSDPKTVALAVKELISTDLRKNLSSLRTPVLLIAASAGMPEQFASGIEARYEAQVAAAPEHQVVVATNARHFVMLDDPAFLFTAIDSFLKLDADAPQSSKVEGRR